MGDYTSFTIADIPGIIENAHLGAGLGLTFLRHTERTVLLIHLIDASDFVEEDPVDMLHKIDRELALYSTALSEKNRIIVATKLDIAHEGVRLGALRDYCSKSNLPFYAISAATGEGVDELIGVLSTKVIQMKADLKESALTTPLF
jgi:GTP-binding protein